MISDVVKGEVLAIGALFFYATNIVLVKVASARLSLNAGYLISVAVNVGFAALLFAAELLLRTLPLDWDWRGFLLFAGAGVFSTYLGRWFNFEAIMRLGPARASTFQVSSPLFAVLMAWLWLGERLPPSTIVAMLVTIAGLLLVSLPRGALSRFGVGRRAAGEASGSRNRWTTILHSGALLGLASSAAYAVGYVLRGAGIRQWDEAVLGTLLGAMAGMALQLLFGKDTLSTLRGLRTLDRRGVVLFAIGGVLTICAQTSVVVALRYVPVAVVALITLCTPLVVFPLSYFMLRNQEQITIRTLVGGALTLAGIAVLVLR
jgi:drug/metabolite transporter (DMT)-like permease